MSICLLFGMSAGASAQDGDALVIVNGQPIARQRVINLLMESHGLAAMQQLIVLELAKEETKARGLTVTPAEVDAEFRDSLDKLAAGASPGAALDDAAKRQALDMLLEDKGLSMAEFMVGMERNAHLRKLVEKDLSITDEDLRAEFGRAYGEKVRARQIVLADATAVREAIEALNSGEEFATVAKRLSADAASAATGGQLPPFSADDASIPPALREAAFALKDNTVSTAIRIDERYLIVKVESRIAPESVRFEDVRADLLARVKARALPQKMSALAAELFRKAKIRVLDPKLKEQYDALVKRSAAGP